MALACLRLVDAAIDIGRVVAWATLVHISTTLSIADVSLIAFAFVGAGGVDTFGIAVAWISKTFIYRDAGTRDAVARESRFACASVSRGICIRRGFVHAIGIIIANILVAFIDIFTSPLVVGESFHAYTFV